MSKFIRSIKEVYSFDGDKVEVTLKPILFEDTLRFHSLQGETDEQRMFSVAKLFSEILPKYVEKFDLKDAEGASISVEDLCSFSYFNPLLIEIGSTLIGSGTPKNP